MFTHLHVHTEYSLLDGLSRIQPLVHQARELGMDSLAITDHGALYGSIEFYTAAREAGIKPILGVEAYVALESRHSRANTEKGPHHLTLLARDNRGYANLLQLVTKANLEGFYYKPRMDKDLLAQHSQGLIALSGCPSAEIPRLIQEGRRQEAAKAAHWYRETFDQFYLELQEHATPGLETLNRELVSLGQEMGIPLVATNDVHYVHRHDAPLQDILICIHTNTNVHDDKRLKMDDDTFHLRSPKEMEEAFSHIPQALLNTQAISQMCHVELDFASLHLPHYHTPEAEPPDEYLSRLAWEGLRQRYPQGDPHAESRLRYELEVIKQTRFANYFLVVWDIASFARGRGILFGVRGSAAASVVLYCLGVTNIDPLFYRLVFERFLNVERRESPDIDMDFQDDRRHEVINYLTHKYGRDHVAQIITFGTLGAKAAIRDVGRAMGLTYADVDRVARLIPFRTHTLDEALQTIPELSEIHRADDTIQKLIDTARALEGTVRHASTHAAGVVITQEPLTEHVPLQRPIRGGEEEMGMTQYAMEGIAKLGLLKMDLLGLINLTILRRTMDMVARTRGVNLELSRIPLDNPETFQLLSSGDTTGLFQLESSGMRRYIKQLQPTSLLDVAAMIALYRPGPMEHIDTFIRAKHGQQPIHYPHSALQEILQETYGVIVYQDQVLLIAQAFSGYSLGEADVMRKAMGKKIPEVMRQERERFLRGAKARGFSRGLAEEVFNLIEPFAGYAFNKAHSVSYALIAYWTAYFKANYTPEYMASLVNSYLGQTEKVALFIIECRRLGIAVLPPHVNYSEGKFTIEEHQGKPALRFGLEGVKNVGSGAIQPLVEERVTGGPYASLEQLCHRVDLRSLNRRTMESLIKVGALDAFGPRGSLLTGVSSILRMAQQETRRRESGQATMFDMFGVEKPAPYGALNIPKEEDASPAERRAWEEELLGISLEGNPVLQAVRDLPPDVLRFRDDIEDAMEGQRVRLLGQISSIRTLTTKSDGKPFVSVSLELMGGGIEVTAYPKVYRETQEMWDRGVILTVWGSLRLREGRLLLICEGAKTYKPAPAGPPPPPQEPVHTPVLTEPDATPKRMDLILRESLDHAGDLKRLEEIDQIVMDFPGPDPVTLIIKKNGETLKVIPLRPVQYSPGLHRRLAGLLGEGSIKIEESQD